MEKEVKLVLGGGAAYGLAHTGVLAAVAETYRITGIVGSSMGAIVGGLYALGKTPQEILQLALDHRSERIFHPFSLALAPRRAPVSLRDGLLGRHRLLSLFESWAGEALIEDLPLPFIAVAFDLQQSKTVLIDRGPLARAMRASSSLPLVFPPHPWGEYLFVDGGVEHPLPLSFSGLLPGNYTIAVNVLPPVAAQAERIKPSPTAGTRRLWPHQVFVRSVLMNQGYVAVQELLRQPPDLYIDAHDPSKGLTDMAEAREFYDFGYEAARRAIEQAGEPRFMEQLLKAQHKLLAGIARLREGLHP